MSTDYRQLTAFLVNLGIEKVPHTRKNYLAHLVAVYKLMESCGQPEDLCRAGLFHSIYGTARFQGFKLPLEQRGAVAELIGPRAERLAFWNCMMDRDSFDRLLPESRDAYSIRNRETGEPMQLTRSEYDELCSVHLFDWLEQAPRSTFGWDYRRSAYRQMAERVGPVAVAALERVYAQAS
jgi:hypothetical protein